MPLPSNPRGDTPWKSLMLGRARETSLSRNSHMRAPRRVTVQATGIPWRTLKPATDFFALLRRGRCPVMAVSSAMETSMYLMSTFASPAPMFTTIFFRRGISMTFL